MSAASALLPFYNLSLGLYRLGVSVSAGLGNEKAKKWIQGREDLLKKIEADFKGNKAETVWMHCSSLGEFEQGRALLEMIREAHPSLKIVLTFFSPSGYEVRKNYPHADHVYYLPFDSKKNAAKFIEIIKPRIAIFIKYEFWYHYLRELQARGISSVLVSAIFRKSQPFFRAYGTVHRAMLRMFSHLFVQDENSVNLLKKIGISNITRVPDTRIDRVSAIAAKSPALPSIEEFLGSSKAWIGGSIYKEENELLLSAFRKGLLGEKIILAPHAVDEDNISELLAPWGEIAFRYTRITGENLKSKKVLFIDTVGMLSSLYRYGSAAFIGGGFGKSIHNILEPAAFGIPIIFGPHHKKFSEAGYLIEKGGAFSIKHETEFEAVLKMLANPETSMNAGLINKKFIEENTGGSAVVFDWLKGMLIN